MLEREAVEGAASEAIAEELRGEYAAAEAALERARRHGADAAALERARLEAHQAHAVELLTREHTVEMTAALASFDATTAKVVAAAAQAAASAAAVQGERTLERARAECALEVAAARAESARAPPSAPRDGHAVLRFPIVGGVADLPARVMLETELEAARVELDGARIQLALMRDQLDVVVGEGECFNTNFTSRGTTTVILHFMRSVLTQFDSLPPTIFCSRAQR